MQYKGKEISQEMLRQAEQCKTVLELVKLAEENGIELSVEEAEAFLDENADIELDAETLDQAAGGGDCYTHVPECILHKTLDCNRCPKADVKDKNRIDE